MSFRGCSTSGDRDRKPVLVDRYHPARAELPKLAASRRAFGQATIRHAVFGISLGLLEHALDDRRMGAGSRVGGAPASSTNG